MLNLTNGNIKQQMGTQRPERTNDDAIKWHGL